MKPQASRQDQQYSLDDTVLETVRSVAKRQSYPADHVLVAQGAVEHTFYVIASGHVEVVRQIEGDEERFLSVLGPNQYFGEMGLLDEGPRFATIRALTEVDVYEIDEERFQALMELNPALVLSMMRGVLSSLRGLDKRTIQELSSKNELLERAYTDLQDAQSQLVEKERLEREMELAAEVQRGLLPATLPQPPGYQFATYLMPALFVGGDFYDVSSIDDENIAILMADVADKGLHAAMMMAVTRTLFYQASRRSLSPSEVALEVHRGLLNLGGAHDNRYSDVFVTAFYGVLHCPTGRLTYVRAAQERPLLQSADNQPVPLAGEGRFLGMLEELILTEYEVILKPADTLLLFSDGVTDAQNRAGESYGYGRLVETYFSARHLDAAELVERLVSDVNWWMEDAHPFDDVSMLAIQVKDTP